MTEPQGDRESPARPGDRLGRYQILAEVGRGGMGVVYRAKDLELRREVVLKCPWPQLAADARFRQRFLKEARTTARISHPNIIEIYEVFEHQGLPWLVLQLVEGEDLEALLVARGRLPIREILRYAEDVATALQAAHAHKVLHRDITPRNVMITRDGRALLADFGLAHIMSADEVTSSNTTQDASLTREGAVVGTPRYMSPEQALGKPLDARSDIFSLGAVLYEMCTAKPAFSPSAEGGLYEAIIHGEPKPISRFTYEIPGEFERIVRKALAKLPAERYQDARDLLVDLRALRRQLEHKEYKEAHPRPPRALPGGRRVAILLALLAAVVVVAAVVLWLARRGGIDQPLPRGLPRQVTFSDALDGQAALSPDGSRIAYASNASGNLDIYIVDVRGGNPLQLTQHPAADSYPAWFPDGSRLAFTSGRGDVPSIWKVGQLGGGATLIVENARHPAVSPGGGQIAFSRPGPGGDLRICVAPLEDPTRVTVLTHDDDGLWSHRHPAWSPDGRLICYATQHDLWVVPAAGGTARPLSAEGIYDSQPAWSPSGGHVYFSSHRAGTLALWRIRADGSGLERLTMGTGRENDCSVARDGSRIAYATETPLNELLILDRDTGGVTELPGLRDADMPSLSPDKTRMAFVSSRGGSDLDLWIQSLEAGVPTSESPKRITDQPGDASHPAFSPNGQWIAYYRTIDQQRDIWVVPAGGGQPVRITEDAANDIQPTWSPAGNALAFVSEREGGSAIWETGIEEGRPAAPPRRLSQPDLVALAPVWSPDGRTIAFVALCGALFEVWVIPADGSAPGRCLTQGAGAQRVRWDATSGGLLVSGSWGEETISLRRVSVDDGKVTSHDPPVVLGTIGAVGHFDLSADGTLLVFAHSDLKGNIWVLEAEQGSY